VLGAFYLRLVGRPVDIYKYLELLYNDYRKIRHRTAQGYRRRCCPSGLITLAFLAL